MVSLTKAVSNNANSNDMCQTDNNNSNNEV